MIFVACGTHHQPFDRLVRAAQWLALSTDERVVLQRGASDWPAPACEVHDEVAPERFERWLREARIVVLHAGSSSYLEARSAGRTPILVPRRPRFGEHVDDHQVRFARSVADRVVLAEPHELVDVVRRFEELRTAPEPLGRGFAERFGALMTAWHSDTRAPRR